MNQCKCQEIGSDGTFNHNESANVNLKMKDMPDWKGSFPCRNHYQNYVDGWGKSMIVHHLAGYNKIEKPDPRKEIMTHMLDMANSFNKVVDEFEKYHPKSGRSNEERQLRGVLKQIANYGATTALHTFYVPSSSSCLEHEVKQMLNGNWTCDCWDCYYRQHECKHIAKVKADPDNLSDISYGVGAIEATRRLQAVAKRALEPVASLVKEPRYKMEFIVCGNNVPSNNYPGTYSSGEADEIITGKYATENKMIYRKVKV